MTGAKRGRPKKPKTRGEKVIAFIEKYCITPEGEHVGKPMRLLPFQKKFILDIYDNPRKTRRAYLSIARKNGKTSLIAAIVLAHVAGPEAVYNSQIVSGARSREQASIVFKLAWKMVMLSPELSERIHVVPSHKIIVGMSRNVEYKALSAEGSTNQGLSPVLAILDEVGQVRGPQDDFVDAITTAQGAYDDALLIAISTQAPSDDDMFSIWIDDALKGEDPHTICHLYCADRDANVMDEEGWKKANPALGTFRSLRDLRDQADRARRMPSSESTFRNLILNQRVEVFAPFVSRNVWEQNAAAPSALSKETRVWGGLDLSSVADLTALVLQADDGSIHPTFWLPGDGIEDKAKEDRTPWDVWAKEGLIELVPGKAIEYEFVARRLREVFDTCDVQKIGFDRYNFRFLRPYLVKVGFSDEELAKFVEFGQGFVSMSPALRETEARLLTGKLRHGNHKVLTLCAKNATIIKDQTGNRKFAKHKAKGRIDGMVALAISCGVMPVEAEPQYTAMFV